jgi:phosphocarrier protein HPr
VSPTSEVQVTIKNRLGLHARPAAHFVRLSSRFRSDVLVARDDVEVNGKSIMGVMMLAAECGATLVIRAVGEDSEDAARELAALVERGFDEDDEGRPIDRSGESKSDG